MRSRRWPGVRLPRPAPPPSYRRALWTILGALSLPVALGVLAGLIAAGAVRADGGGSADSTGSAVDSITASAVVPPELSAPLGSDAPLGTDPAEPDAPLPPAPTRQADDAHRARVGDCFTETGSPSSPRLRLDSCGPGAYELVERFPDASDNGLCRGIDRVNWTVTYPDLVLCLAYRYSDSGGNAPVGGCVADSADGQHWSQVACTAGAFTVTEKHHNTTSYAQCRARNDYHMGISYTHSWHAELNVVLCLRFNYPDDSAYAGLRDCLAWVKENGHNLLRAGSCTKGNVYVTGRTGTVDKSFCGNDGSWYYQHPRHRNLDYTICWRWI